MGSEGLLLGIARLLEGMFAGVVLTVFAFIVLRERLRPQPADYKELVNTVSGLATEIARLSLRQRDMESIITKYDSGVRKLVAQVRRLGHEPDWEPNGALDKMKSGSTPKVRTFDLMMEHFSREEMEGIMFGMGIKADDLNTENRPALFRSLIEHIDRRGMGQDLLGRLKQERPTVDWPSEIE